MNHNDLKQVTIDDYRDIFLHDNLPLTAFKVHRSVVITFIKSSRQYNFNLTTRNIFDYLCFNANVDRKSDTFGEVSDVCYEQIGEYVGKKKRTVENEIVKLTRAGLIERHNVKRRVFIIPSIKH